MTDNTINNDMTMGGATGALLAGRYRVVKQLGQGGMGSVWLAEDTKLDGFKVAIKMLPSVLVNNKRAYAQVKAEALVSLKLSHPNIATVRAFEEEGGNPFLVMDYIDGQTLDDYLAEKGKLTEEETVKLLKPVAAALDYAHAQGVVHRDVKPGNVMIRKDGTPFILDFGIAREIQETMTRVTGKLSSGTLLYMSPEQLNGDAPKPAQDIYSFAAMAYECLKGHPPFSRGQIEYQIEHDTPESLEPQFANCGSGVMTGLAKMPEMRPGSCSAVITPMMSASSKRTRWQIPFWIYLLLGIAIGAVVVICCLSTDSPVRQDMVSSQSQRLVECNGKQDKASSSNKTETGEDIPRPWPNASVIKECGEFVLMEDVSGQQWDVPRDRLGAFKRDKGSRVRRIYVYRVRDRVKSDEYEDVLVPEDELDEFWKISQEKNYWVLDKVRESDGEKIVERLTDAAQKIEVVELKKRQRAEKKVGNGVQPGMSLKKDILDLTTKPVDDFRQNVRVSCINVAPDGRICVGFSDMSGWAAQKHYYLAVGEQKDGWQVMSADPQSGRVRISKDGLVFDLQMGR